MKKFKYTAIMVSSDEVILEIPDDEEPQDYFQDALDQMDFESLDLLEHNWEEIP